jgi:homoserine dehydrogenase
MTSGKNVVTANKKMLACHLPELISLQREHHVSLLYEAAVCGSIPILRNLEEYYNNDLLQSISGIVNGSTNFILTAMCDRQIPYSEALAAAQEAGFIESDPLLDVEGYDAQNKLTLLLKHTFGLHVKPDSIFSKGITSISQQDISYAKEKGLSIKLIAKAYFNEQKEIVAYVLPQFIKPQNQLSHVNNEYNGILIGSLLADEQFLYGKGAGRYPTASAVLSDISALNYGYRYEYKKTIGQKTPALGTENKMQVYLSWKNPVKIDKSLFDSISANFLCHEGNYLTGLISLENLKNLLCTPGVSLIELPAGSIPPINLTPLTAGRLREEVLRS